MKTQHTPTFQQQLQDLESQYGVAYIVHAVSVHDGLITLLKETLQAPAPVYGGTDQIGHIRAQIKEVLDQEGAL